MQINLAEFLGCLCQYLDSQGEKHDEWDRMSYWRDFKATEGNPFESPDWAWLPPLLSRYRAQTVAWG